jgi:hypothetical protein
MRDGFDTPARAGALVGLTGRMVRNLIHAGILDGEYIRTPEGRYLVNTEGLIRLWNSSERFCKWIKEEEDGRMDSGIGTLADGAQRREAGFGVRRNQAMGGSPAATPTGERKMTDAIISTECKKLERLLLAKHANYGESAGKTPCLTPGISPGTALLVRASDKVARIATLAAGEPDLVGESLEDTVRDLAGYCLLWLAYRSECQLPKKSPGRQSLVEKNGSRLQRSRR